MIKDGIDRPETAMDTVFLLPGAIGTPEKR